MGSTAITQKFPRITFSKIIIFSYNLRTEVVSLKINILLREHAFSADGVWREGLNSLEV